MLVLSQKPNEAIAINGGAIKVTIVSVRAEEKGETECSAS